MSTPSRDGVRGVERVLGVDERGDAARRLRLGDDLQRERGLARGLRAVDLDDAAARHAADAEGGVERERAGGDRGDLVGRGVLAELHERALAELLLDLLLRDVEHLFLLALHAFTRSIRVSGDPWGSSSNLHEHMFAVNDTRRTAQTARH